MNIEELSSMLSNKTGMQQSIAGTVISAVLSYAVQHFMQKGASGFMGLGGSDAGSSLQSMLSQLTSGINDPGNPLVQQVKKDGGLNDDNQARQYTQQTVDVLKESANKDSAGLSSLIGSFLGANKQGGGGGVGDIIGGLLGGAGKK
ncbi:hypothetical protein NTE_01768 [Candidatus Nitrososphaera evergladensis SR1]|jgi:hypothetical protein|uniref:DUF937 domain-containing protein n=1 Tax=Candidatus Nitrososphaera evergladensis SR1 TaxID=1459636 RepID=A0A075MX19_9ARCH|nr:hypothetical protein [Candidatus Nitrososphaera evergladensis]AIF83829.1 hypothetical protein NTE_01768 [Candidatus Nitrososphaera evergladensis SR1]